MFKHLDRHDVGESNERERQRGPGIRHNETEREQSWLLQGGEEDGSEFWDIGDLPTLFLEIVDVDVPSNDSHILEPLLGCLSIDMLFLRSGV